VFNKIHDGSESFCYKQVIIAGELVQIGASEASRKGIVKNWLVVQNIAKRHLRKRISNHQMRGDDFTAVLPNIWQNRPLSELQTDAKLIPSHFENLISLTIRLSYPEISYWGILLPSAKQNESSTMQQFMHNLYFLERFPHKKRRKLQSWEGVIAPTTTPLDPPLRVGNFFKQAQTASRAAASFMASVYRARL